MYIFLAALAGCVLGAFGSALYINRQFAQLRELSELYQLAQLEEEAGELYRSGDARVAIYVMNKARELSVSYKGRLALGPGAYADAVFHARVGKLHDRLGETALAKQAFDSAVADFGRMGWTFRDTEEMLAALALIDQNKASQALEEIGTYQEPGRAER